MYRIGIVGLHSLPNQHGGFEQYFSYLLDNKTFQNFAISNQITFYCEESYDEALGTVSFSPVSPPKGQSGSKYYSRAMAQALRESDFVYCCGAGGGLGLAVRFLSARARKVRIAINVDGEEYKRTKYGLVQRIAIYWLHVLSMIAADIIVLDSRELEGRLPLTKLYRNKLRLVPYFFPSKLADRLGEQQDNSETPFDLVVARLVPENNIELIIRAKLESRDEVPLLVIGNTDTPHGLYLLKQYGDRIQFLGGIYDQERLNQLRTSCRYYIHGHSVGGANPSLIEALGLCKSILAFDTPYNRDVAEACATYFDTKASLQKVLLCPTLPTADRSECLAKFNEDNAIETLLSVMARN